MENTNIKIKSIEETSGEIELIKTNSNAYTAIIPLSQIKAGKISEITVQIEWQDLEENNESDLEISSTYDFKLQIPINVHVSQYLGEEVKAWDKDV